MAKASSNVIPITRYGTRTMVRPAIRLTSKHNLGDWGHPVLNPSLGELPTGSYTLQSGQLYTFIIRLDGRPNEANVADIISNNNKGIFFDLLSVTSTFGSYDYNIAIRMKKNMGYTQLINLLKLWINVDLGYKVQEIDFKGGVEPAPGIVKEITSGVTAPVTGVAQVVTGLTSNIKWIAIAGAAILGLWYLGPMIKSGTKNI